MSGFKSNVVSATGALLLMNLTFAYYMQKLAQFSFDMNTMNEYPSNYETAGTAVPLKNKVKIVPKIPNVMGKIFAIDKLDTLQWETQFKIKVDFKQKEVLKEGDWEDVFAIWYMISTPKLLSRENKTPDAFGYKAQFSGIGIFVYREGDDFKLQVL